MGNSIVGGQVQDQAYKAQLFRQLAYVPADVRAFIAQQYAQTQISVLPLPYWSTNRFQGTIASNQISIAAGVKSKAFAYAIGNPMQIAGFPTGFRVATPADTNLLTQSQTRDNADVWIWGLAASPTPDSEPLLMQDVWRNTSVAISLNGTQSIPLGTLKMFPGAGGLYGAQTTYLAAPPTYLAGPTPTTATSGLMGTGQQVGFLSNGNPMAGNFFRLPQPFKWSAIGSAGSDSSLVIDCTLETAITRSVSGARTAVPVVSMVTPGTIEPFTLPAAGGQGTYVDIQWQLICVAVAKRSVNT